MALPNPLDPIGNVYDVGTATNEVMAAQNEWIPEPYVIKKYTRPQLEAMDFWDFLNPSFWLKPDAVQRS